MDKQNKVADMPTNMIPIFEAKSGEVFYQFTRDAEMTYKRFFAAQIQEKFIRFGITESFLRDAIELGIAISFDKTRTEQQARQDCATVFQNLKMRLGYLCGEDAFLNLASVFFVLEGEPLDTYSETWTKRKKEIWEADPVAKDFFLQKAFNISQNYVSTSPEDIRDFLRIAEERESNIPTLPAI